MRAFLNKKITVKQFIIIIGVLLAVFFISFNFYFTNSLPPAKVGNNKKSPADSIVTEITDTNSFTRLNMYLDSLAQSNALTNAGFGFCLIDIDSSKIILEYNSVQSLVPASVLKVVTTGAALKILGPGYRFPTRVLYDGTIEKGNKKLNGNIYISGTGDPTLGSDVFGSTRPDSIFKIWFREIKKLGIDTISGAVIGDAGVFEDELVPAGWAWEDMQADYCAGACGLSFCENMYDISVVKRNNAFSVSPVQKIPNLKLYSRVAGDNTASKSYLFVSGSPYVGERYLTGLIGPENEFIGKSVVPDPPLYCAFSFYNYLRSHGIVVKDSVTTVRQQKLNGIYEKKERKSICTTVSPSLLQIAFHTNHVSQNFYAETLLKTISLKENGYGSTSGGVNRVMQYWKENNVDLAGLCMVDGSGVSRFNTITARQLAQVMAMYANDSLLFDSFYSTLAIAGESGTLRSVADGTIAEGNIRAKSGYMSRVRSYTGYVKNLNGKMLAFSMIANNHDCTSVEIKEHFERLMVLMTELDVP